MTDVQLLNKTEVWINGIHLSDVNLPRLANTCAEVLDLPSDKVFVIDVRGGIVVLDILVSSVNFEHIAGKQSHLFSVINKIPGVSLEDNAHIHSEGVLGMIGQNREVADRAIKEARRMDQQLRQYTSGRVAIISTGTELLDGSVKDTNFKAAKEVLGNKGYDVIYAGVAGDSENEIAGMINRVASDGFGIIITTGGVGAEDKDKTVEALALIDPELSTATLACYQKGHGRHVKDRVRIGVAKLGWATIIALPGPTHEVQLALPIIALHMKEGSTLHDLAEAIAKPLRATLPKHNPH